MQQWDRGWDAVLKTADSLTDADLDKTVAIRGEPHTVYQALTRGLTHIAYHTGQILYLVRTLLTPMPSGKLFRPANSAAHRPSYRLPPTR